MKFNYSCKWHICTMESAFEANPEAEEKLNQQTGNCITAGYDKE